MFDQLTKLGKQIGGDLNKALHNPLYGGSASLLDLCVAAPNILRMLLQSDTYLTLHNRQTWDQKAGQKACKAHTTQGLCFHT